MGKSLCYSFSSKYGLTYFSLSSDFCRHFSLSLWAHVLSLMVRLGSVRVCVFLPLLFFFFSFQIFARRKKKKVLFLVCLGFCAFPSCMSGEDYVICSRSLWMDFGSVTPCGSAKWGRAEWSESDSIWLVLAGKYFRWGGSEARRKLSSGQRTIKGVSGLILPPTPSSFHCEKYLKLPSGPKRVEWRRIT